jgi:hypothetical protein
VSERIQLWSCGGGRQSAGIAALMKLGRLRRPDYAVMTRLPHEKRSTWEYVNAYIRPTMHEFGVPFKVVSSVEYRTKDLFGGEDLKTPLMPVYTNQSGEVGKLNEWCSGDWKRDVVMRWASGRKGWKKRGVDNWIGISADESDRRRSPRRKWFKPVYPLLDWFPKLMSVSACLDAVADAGWPPPPRSRCVMCPNQKDAEWAELNAKEWEEAAKVEDEIRKTDPNAFLHKSCVPLRLVVLKPSEEADGLFGGGCQSGMCF